MIYVRWFTGDYLRDTIHLSWLEDCAYRRLLDIYYTQGKALTTNRAILYRQVRAATAEEMAAVESVLSQYFFKRGKNLHNKKANAELLRNDCITAVRVKAAKEKAKQAANALHVQSTSSAIPYPDPDPDPDKEKNKSGAGESAAYIERIFSPFLSDLGIPLALFMDYKNLRTRLNRPIVPGQETHVFAELTALKSQGGDPIEILTFAVRNSSWKLTLPPSTNGTHKGETKDEARKRRTEEAIQRVLQKPDH